MKIAWFIGISFAVLVHAGVLLFGGIFFMKEEVDHGTLQEVELLAETDAEDEKEEAKAEPTDESEEVLETETEEAPDAAEMLRNLEMPSSNDAPALDAASLSAIEAALSGQSGGGDFGDALTFNSGGRIGGTGSGDASDRLLDDALSIGDIDQPARNVFQTTPLYPAEMRGKKLEGVVRMVFLVDATGKVTNPRVESSNHPAFDKPAIEAVKQWKFEPALRGGKRVPYVVRVPIRFQVN